MDNVLMKRLGELATLDFGIQFIGWGIASLLKTERFYDTVGSLTYWAMTMRARAVAAEGAAEQGVLSLRQKVCSVCVLAWTTRLGLFLATRGWKYGDSRFDKVKHQPIKFLGAWFLQGTWCFLTALPLYLQLLTPQKEVVPVGALDVAAWTGWLSGFLIEVFADRQKSAWREAGNKGFINVGLWRYSQHPNYFGEILLWFSLYFSCIQDMGTSWYPKLAGLASPSLVYLLLCHGSGIPMLKAAARRKYGNDPKYIDYISRTSLLVPWPPRQS